MEELQEIDLSSLHIDPDEGVVDINRAGVELLGYSKQELKQMDTEEPLSARYTVRRLEVWLVSLWEYHPTPIDS